jgi:hypothetical protein
MKVYPLYIYNEFRNKRFPIDTICVKTISVEIENLTFDLRLMKIKFSLKAKDFILIHDTDY